MPKRQVTTRDVASLYALQQKGQLTLRPEFQRNSVWPRPAKAYLIDTILNDRPVPLLFFQRVRSPQTGRLGYAVVDGQQRLRAIFDFIDNHIPLSQTPDVHLKNKRFDQLSEKERAQILGYDLIIEELSDYSMADIRDMFVRLNKYVVKLSPQELRHAREEGTGAFARFAERIGSWRFWLDNRVFTPTQIERMRAVEFAAELIILLSEGPQDKKFTIDLYYGEFQNRFPGQKEVHRRLSSYREWLNSRFPHLSSSRFRRPTDLYSLIGAMDRLASRRKLFRLSRRTVTERLDRFEERTRTKNPIGQAARYVAAASRQTDNIQPRLTRIDILEHLLS